MSQQCVALANKNTIVKQSYWNVFTDEKAPRQDISNSIVFSTGQTTFGIWSERLECAQLRTTRKARCLDAMSWKEHKSGNVWSRWNNTCTRLHLRKDSLITHSSKRNKAKCWLLRWWAPLLDIFKSGWVIISPGCWGWNSYTDAHITRLNGF